MPVQFSDPRIKLADINGDGLQDIVLVDYGTFVYWPNKGHGQWGVGGQCDEYDGRVTDSALLAELKDRAKAMMVEGRDE